jgi:hypothetical protein
VTSVLSFIAERRDGILLLLLTLIVLCVLVNWVLWMLGWGRFRGAVRTESKLRFILADLFVKIINDFRHLLALVIVVLFSLALFAAIWPGMMKQDVALIKEGLQGVAATLGGLIGAIIGYYFGESAASRSRLPGADQPPSTPPTPAEPGEGQGKGDDIKALPKPPSLLET